VLAAKKMSITMPRGPQGHKRSADTVANAIYVAKFLTGEIEEDMGGSGKDKAPQSLGQRGAARMSLCWSMRLKASRRSAVPTRSAGWLKFQTEPLPVISHMS